MYEIMKSNNQSSKTTNEIMQRNEKPEMSIISIVVSARKIWSNESNEKRKQIMAIVMANNKQCNINMKNIES